MVNCLNIECSEYGQQPDCFNTCPLMTRALLHGTSCTISHGRIWRTKGDPLALFTPGSNTPEVIPAGTAPWLKGHEIFGQSLQIYFPPSLLKEPKFIIHDKKVYVMLDPKKQKTDTLHRIAFTLDGNMNPTAGPYDLFDWYKALMNGGSCEHCIRYYPPTAGLNRAWQLPFAENVTKAEAAVLERLERQRASQANVILTTREADQEKKYVHIKNGQPDQGTPMALRRSDK